MVNVTLKFESLEDAAWLVGIVQEAVQRQNLSECSKGILRDTLKKAKEYTAQNSAGVTYTSEELRKVRAGYSLNS